MMYAFCMGWMGIAQWLEHLPADLEVTKRFKSPHLIVALITLPYMVISCPLEPSIFYVQSICQALNNVSDL